MIEELKEIERTVLMDLLRNPSIWNTLDVDYHPPRVERLWTQLAGDQRLMLHIIHPCKEEEALYHPHPWPSAMHILDGKYCMGIGVRNDSLISGKWNGDKKTVEWFGNVVKSRVPIREICKVELKAGDYYNMLDVKGWHRVFPIGEPCMTLMLIGKPWDKNVLDDRDVLIKTETLEQISDDRKQEILEKARDIIMKRSVTA